jgi:Zn-dependent peptidase ImmA (M78 family)
MKKPPFSIRRVKTISAGMAELKRIIKMLGIELKESNERYVTIEEEGITMHYPSNIPKRNQLWALAHELGHVLAAREYPKRIRKKFVPIARSRSFYELEDECQAWAWADVLLSALNPRFYNTDYIKMKVSCLKAYFRQI